MDWFYADAGKQVGPIDDATFQGLVTAGIVRDETLVWSSGLVNWQPYRTVRPAILPIPVPLDGGAGETRFCTECGRSYPADELLAFGSSIVCAACKPVFTQKLREGIRPAGAMHYGGFWIRYLAVLLDGLMFSVVIVIFFGIGIMMFPVDLANIGHSQADLMRVFAIEGIVWSFSLLLTAAYEIWMICRYAATLGKMACGLRVVMSDGGKVSYGRSVGRYFAKMLSSFVFMIGYIMAGFDEEKRALHDRICDTRVIKK